MSLDTGVLTDVFSPDELVIYNNRNGQLCGGGFKLKSVLSRKNKDKKKCESIELLAIPAGLLYTDIPYSKPKADASFKTSVINDDLFDNLIVLASPDAGKPGKKSDKKKQRKTKGKKPKSNGKKKLTKRKKA
jgi:hypothetical protein